LSLALWVSAEAGSEGGRDCDACQSRAILSGVYIVATQNLLRYR
jgi:hypothetical protein